MSLRQLKWLTIIAPLVFLVGLDVLRRSMGSDVLQSRVGDDFVLGVVLFGVLLFCTPEQRALIRLSGPRAWQPVRRREDQRR